MLSSDFFRNWNPDFFGFLEKSRSRLFYPRFASLRGARALERPDLVYTTSVQQISRTFQGLLKDKLQFSRTKIYSLTPS